MMWVKKTLYKKMGKEHGNESYRVFCCSKNRFDNNALSGYKFTIKKSLLFRRKKALLPKNERYSSAESLTYWRILDILEMVNFPQT